VLTNGTGYFESNATNIHGLIGLSPSTSTGAGVLGITYYSANSNFAAVQGEYVGSGIGAGTTGYYGGTNTGTTVSGIYGQYQTTVTAAGGIGVHGHNANTTGTTRMGVMGDYDGNAYGIGVIGVGYGGSVPTATADYAVVGWVANNANYAGYYNGNHVIANGTKSGSVPTTRGNQLLYTTESPEVWFEDLGRATLVNGETTVQLDPLFLETVVIDSKHPMHVFVQLEGEANDVYVEPGTTSFKVKEKANGKSNVNFSYRIMAKRVHFQDHRFGNDPVWGEGDTRRFSQYSTPPSIDYHENLQIQAQKRNEAVNTPVPDNFTRATGNTK
jgi:hypothetical protein